MFGKRSAPHGESAHRDTDRLETFSDGVFAIAITLLILEIRIPTVDEAANRNGLWRELIDLWPSYFGYLISFMVIGIMWINHHHVFKFLDGVDPWLLAINLALLLCVAFIPFPTSLVAEHISEPDERTATLLYSGVFFVTSLIFLLLWRYPTRWAPWLLVPNADPDAIATITRRFAYGPPAYLAAAIVSWISPTAGLVALALAAVLFLAPSLLGDPVEPTTD